MIKFCDASGYSLQDLAEAMTHCFEDYVVPATFAPSSLSHLICIDGADLLSTVVAEDDGQMAGILLVNRRGRRMRVGAMAVAKAHRGKQLGSRLMREALNAAQGRGERHAVLEAIEHNVRAIRFYERHGFRMEYRLISAELRAERSGDEVREITTDEMARMPFLSRDFGDCWEINSTSVGQMALPIVAYEFEGLAAAVSPRGEDVLVCHALSLSGAEDGRKLRSLTGGLAAAFPRRKFKIPPIFPEPIFRDVFAAAGFKFGSLNQVQMSRELG